MQPALPGALLGNCRPSHVEHPGEKLLTTTTKRDLVPCLGPHIREREHMTDHYPAPKAGVSDLFRQR